MGIFRKTVIKVVPDQFVAKMREAIAKLVDGSPERLSLEIQLQSYLEQKRANAIARVQRAKQQAISAEGNLFKTLDWL